MPERYLKKRFTGVMRICYGVARGTTFLRAGANNWTLQQRVREVSAVNWSYLRNYMATYEGTS